MRPLVTSLLILIIGGGPCRGQEPQSRPASRPAGEPTAAEWQEWMQGLATKPAPDVFSEAEASISMAWFAAARLADCGAKPMEGKSEKGTLLQRVPYVVAGFDAKQTFIEATRASGCRIDLGSGFGVRGVESLDVSGIAEMCVADVKAQKAEGVEDSVDPELLRKILEGLIKGGPIQVDASKLQHANRIWDPRNRVLLTVVRNNHEKPEQVPRFVRGLKSRGARAVVLIADKGAAATSGKAEVMRRDRYRRPATEDPPALFLTEAAAKKLGDGCGVPIDLLLDPARAGPDVGPRLDAVRSELRISVRYRAKDLDIPNVVAKVGPGEAEAVLVSAPAGGSGHLVATLLAATRLLSQMPSSPRRSVILAVHSRPELPDGGQDWFLAHAPLPLGKIVAAVHLAAIEGGVGDPPSSGSVQVLAATRGSQDLQALAAEALRANGCGFVAATKCANAQRAVDAYAAKGIPAIGLLATGETMDDGLVLARVAAALARALADREGRPSLPPK